MKKHEIKIIDSSIRAYVNMILRMQEQIKILEERKKMQK